jgi:hypothetical protein
MPTELSNSAITDTEPADPGATNAPTFCRKWSVIDE